MNLTSVSKASYILRFGDGFQFYSHLHFVPTWGRRISQCSDSAATSKLIATERLNTAVAQKCRIANPPHAREIGKLGLKDDRSYLQGGLSPGDPGMFHHPDWAVGNHNSGHQPGELGKSK